MALALAPWAMDPGVQLGPLGPQGGTSAVKLSLPILPAICMCGTRCSMSPSLLPVSMWLFLSNLSCRTSVQLNFRWFWMIIAPSLVVIMMWLWEDASTSFTCATIWTRNLLHLCFVVVVFPLKMPFPRPSKKKQNRTKKQNYTLFQGWHHFYYLLQSVSYYPHLSLTLISYFNLLLHCKSLWLTDIVA